jgi:Flp pilus assembly protein TadD
VNNKARILSLALNAFLISNLCSAQTQTQTQTSSRINQEEQAIIDEGTALSDQGKYDEAIAKYKPIMDKHPNNVPVLAKMASTYFAAAKYDDAVKIATQGSHIKSDYQPQFYMILGNSLDKLGKTDEAITALKQALEVLPENALIHFNLAALLSNSGAFDDARSHLKTALQFNPNHPSSHFALGQIYYKQEYKFPCTLVLFRFLTLEPNGQRSEKAISMLKGTFADEAVEAAPKDEGDFSKYEPMASSIQLNKQNRVELMKKLFSGMAIEKQKGKFVFDYYFPYFIALQKKGFVETFTNYIYQNSDSESSRWVKDHPDDVQRFLEWSTSFYPLWGREFVD